MLTSSAMGRFTALSTFFPGAFRSPPQPCAGCRRVQGRNSTGCPGCDARLAEEKRNNPKPPAGFHPDNLPFGQAGWRVARGRRNTVLPVQLHDYACFMEQGIRIGHNFHRRKELLPSRRYTTLLDHQTKTHIIRGDGTSAHLLSGTWERPPPGGIRAKRGAKQRR